MNAVALVLSVLMLISWKSVYGETTLPTLTSLNAMNANWMVVVYGICLLLCLISTAVTTTFGFVARFEIIRVLKNVANPVKKRIIVSAFIIIVSMTISLAGLTNIIKYGYQQGKLEHIFHKFLHNFVLLILIILSLHLGHL